MRNNDLAIVLHLHAQTHARRHRLLRVRYTLFCLLMLALGVALPKLVHSEPAPAYHRVDVHLKPECAVSYNFRNGQRRRLRSRYHCQFAAEI